MPSFFLKIFSLTTPVSKYLQTKELDYLAAWTQITAFKKNLTKISSNNHFEVIISEVSSFIEVTEKKILHLQNIEIENQSLVQRNRCVKVMPGEKSTDQLSNFDEKSKFKIQTYRVIMDKVLETIVRRFTNKCNTDLLSLSLLTPEPKYFENLEKRIKKYGNNLEILITNARDDKIKIFDELISFASCYSKLASNFNFNSQEKNVLELDEAVDNDYDTGKE